MIIVIICDNYGPNMDDVSHLIEYYYGRLRFDLYPSCGARISTVAACSGYKIQVQRMPSLIGRLVRLASRRGCTGK